MKKITLTICTASLLLFACNNEKKKDEGKMDKETKTENTDGKMNETVDELFEGEKVFLAKERALSIATVMKIKLKQL